MAFDLCNLSRLCYGNGFTLWAYRAAPGELLSDVDEAAYFAGARAVMNVGDAIMVCDDQGTGLVTPFPRVPRTWAVTQTQTPEATETPEDGVFVTRQDIDSLDEYVAAKAALPQYPDSWGDGYYTGVLAGAKFARNALLGSRA